MASNGAWVVHNLILQLLAKGTSFCDDWTLKRQAILQPLPSPIGDSRLISRSTSEGSSHWRIVVQFPMTRWPVTPEVAGSSPVGLATFQDCTIIALSFRTTAGRWMPKF
jgi:hypothetical protein